MRLDLTAFAVASAVALAACADPAPPTSSTFGDAPASTTTSTTSETNSTPVTTTESTVPAPVTSSEPQAEPADAGAPPAPPTDEPEWMKNCLPFIPCFPPDEPEPSPAEACPPFDPVCQTNAAMNQD
ncbi:MAG: hypothetical protein U0270_44030 [Labilithrix sp.]